jgi:hypothetical protein
MSAPDQLCQEITLRLVAGEPPAGDPALATHVGSCLRCFRTANEMRELPQIARLMRQAERPAPDPGEAFWAHFPRTVSAAWVEERAASDGFGKRGRWLLGWFRLPLPAALSGAAVAAALMMFALNHKAGPRPEPSIGVVAASVVAAADGTGEPAMQATQTTTDEMPSASAPILLDDDDPWSLLEVADMKSAIAQEDGDRDVSALDDPSDGTPSSAEEVGLLDTEDLRAVEQALETRGRI